MTQQEEPQTIQRMPEVTVVELHGRKPHVTHVPERQAQLVQVVDFYPIAQEIIRRSRADWRLM